MAILQIEGLRHTFGDGTLFNNAQLTLNRGEHVGIVGQNGAGKSTLVKFCTGELVPDAGRLAWLPGVEVGCLGQYAETDGATTLHAFLKDAFAPLYQIEKDMNALYTEAASGSEEALLQAAECGERLEAAGFYTIDTRISQVATGLGLATLGLKRPLGEMSGGQRARAILAKLLLQQPDVLLLDEPTNFLDREHVAWLAGFLPGLANAYMVVSHDYDFLEKISTHIVDVDAGQLAKYHGSYSEFMQKKAARRAQHARDYTAQQKEIARTEEFIRRNIAGVNTKMAQGRRKQLARMERLQAPQQAVIRPTFQLTVSNAIATPQLEAKALDVGYYYPVLAGISLAVDAGQKVVLTGFNGVGKSTLLKTLAGQLAPLGGTFGFAPGAAVGYFAQDPGFEEPRHTPLQILSAASPGLTIKQARAQLARCGINSRHAAQPVGTLSGGEAAKLRLCLLQQNPHSLLLMDEPTNHLDQNAKEALQKALQGFAGSVLLVSHEESFYRDWAHRVIDLEKAAKKNTAVHPKKANRPGGPVIPPL